MIICELEEYTNESLFIMIFFQSIIEKSFSLKHFAIGLIFVITKVFFYMVLITKVAEKRASANSIIYPANVLKS